VGKRGPKWKNVVTLFGDVIMMISLKCRCK